MDLEAKAGTVDECLDFIDETTGASRKKWGDFGENEDYLKFFEKPQIRNRPHKMTQRSKR